MTKEQVTIAMQNLPSEFALDELVERLIVLEKIEEAEKSMREGRVFTHEEVKDEIGRWKAESRARKTRSDAA